MKNLKLKLWLCPEGVDPVDPPPPPPDPPPGG